MNNFRICLNNHFVFNGFTVQPGMIFGIGLRGESIITNGKFHHGGFWIYTNLGSLDGEFNRIHITEGSEPAIFHKIQKALRQRKRRNIDGVQYRTSAQLEFERWQADSYQKHFKSACTPIGNTPKIIASKNETGTAKYNAMKERATLTQKANICKYNTAGGYTVII